jgi:Tol biopolymer transport system component
LGALGILVAAVAIFQATHGYGSCSEAQTMEGRVEEDACSRHRERSRRDNRILVAAAFALAGAALGGCDLGEAHHPLTVEQKPTGSTTGVAGAPGSTAGAPGSATGEPAPATGVAGVGGGDPADAWIAFDSDGGAFNRDLYVIRFDGTGRRRLTTDKSVDAQPSFSRDGTKLAFASDRAGGALQIYVMDLATGSTSRVTNRADGAHDPAFVFDGTRVGYRSGISVFTARLDGTDERQVTDGQTCCTGGTFGAPGFPTDGRTIVYDDYNAIYSVTAGAARKTIVIPLTGEQSHPALSPEGSNIVLQSTCVDDDAARSIWSIPATGIKSYSCFDGRRLSPRGTDATHASWGPGDVIVWGSVEGGNNSRSPVPSALTVWQDGNLRTLPNDGADDRNPSWSPPGAVIGNW